MKYATMQKFVAHAAALGMRTTLREESFALAFVIDRDRDDRWLFEFQVQSSDDWNHVAMSYYIGDTHYHLNMTLEKFLDMDVVHLNYLLSNRNFVHATHVELLAKIKKNKADLRQLIKTGLGS